jgi:ketosteroid isomerase-like protein
MSDENVEVVRRVLRCFATGDMDGAFADIHPQATLDWSNSNAPDRGVYVGYDAWRDFMLARDEALAERRFESVELLAPTEDTVVLIGRVQERGRASGIEVESRGAAVWTLSEGKVVRFEIYQSSADALRAVGLEDQAGA